MNQDSYPINTGVNFNGEFDYLINPLSIRYLQIANTAQVVKLVYTLDLGSSASAWRFESSLGH